MTPKAFENDELIWEHCFLCRWTSSPEKWLNLANIKKKQHKIKKSLSSAVINTAGSKEEREAVRGILRFDMWQKRQEVNKAFLYIKNPLIPVCYTCPACSWAAHGQRFIITHRGEDRSHHPGNLWASPLPGEHSGVVYPTHGYNSFLRLGYSLLSFLCVCVCQWKMLL